MRCVIAVALLVPGVALWTLSFMVAGEDQYPLSITVGLIGGMMVGAGGYLWFVRPR